MRLPALTAALLLSLLFAYPASVAAVGPGPKARKGNTRSEQQRIDFREACDNASAQTEMEINNVRARLTTGGDVWWDGANGRYIVPKVPPGVPEVSSIYAGAVWLGGRDPGGGLKVAAQDYGRGSGEFDYYPGPLTPQGTVQRDTCERWDRFFTVRGESIRALRLAYQTAVNNNSLPLDPADVPEDVLGWPSVGNPYFAQVNGFELPNPNEGGGLAGFWDEDLDGLYDPTRGDYPIIEIRGCGETPQFPEEMTFWIYNDAGNTHRQSGTPLQIQMEVQVQAFAYATSDDINNMTFQRYKLINRAQEDILDTYFAMWVDPDLGCASDDYIGSDTTRSLAYVYNEDELDGARGAGCTCDQGVETYCDEIPILGVDYFRGPRAPVYDVNGVQIGERELGMSSFVYYNNAGVGAPPPATTDPSTAEEYYNYLQGRWRDGSPLQSTGDGYDESSAATTRYAFPDAPNVRGWNMTTEQLPFGDRRTIQASGPFTLQPGAVNELIIGVVWVPDQTYPAPSIRRLQQADDLAQSLFDNCFDLLDGPDAPDVDLLELDREVVMLFSNSPISNNFQEAYQEAGLGIPRGEDSLYRFEGYRVFQFAGPDVSLADIDDPERVREVATYDLNNGVTRLFNWAGLTDEDQNPLNQVYFVPELQVDGNDGGIRHSISITQDAFATGSDTRLINHRRYYFTVVAYAYNNYQTFDPFNSDSPGQPTQYIASSRNVGDPLTGNAFYQAIPRPILDRELRASYGDGAAVTRLSGKGNNGNFLDVNDTTRMDMEAAFAGGSTFAGEISYLSGAGPIDVFVANPLDVRDGEYELTFVDDNMADTRLTAPVRWTLRCLDDCGTPTIVSERPISSDNEQIVGEFGFSVRIGDVPEPGSSGTGANGAIGGALVYDSTEQDPWLSFIPDNFSPGLNNVGVNQAIFDYVATDGFLDRYYGLDQDRGLTDMFPGIAPYRLLDHRENEDGIPFISPVYLSEFRQNDGVIRNQSLQDLNNVDIVLTSDKSLWSRCPVIETSSYFYDNLAYRGQLLKPAGARDMFDTRDAPSVTREAGPDGLPAVDNAIDPQYATGMGWFPGYAVDVETGQRLEVFWGENSLYDGRRLGDEYVAPSNGDDMIWNPSSDIVRPAPLTGVSVYDFPAGGQHFFYVTDEPYDGGVRLYNRLFPRSSPNSTAKVRGLQDITWAGFPVLTPGTNLRSYADGIIPNDVTIKLRVNSAFAYAEGVAGTNGYPTYRFRISGQQASTEADAALADRALDMINVVPNPYYGFSIYEDSQFETNVKITNLPARATVTIYSLDGKFIRQYDRAEAEASLGGDNRPVGRRQITPALEWDLRNQKGIPVASGVYLIHVSAPGLGERTLKFFGVQRQFDPSGL